MAKMRIYAKEGGSGQITLHIRPGLIKKIQAALDDLERLTPDGTTTSLVVLQSIIHYRNFLQEREKRLREADIPPLPSLENGKKEEAKNDD